MQRLPSSQFLDEISSAAPATIAQSSNEYLGATADHRRAWAAFACIGIAVLALFARAVDLQVIRGNTLRNVAERNRSRMEFLIPTRGIVTDRNGTPLVRNIPSYAIGVIPADLGASRETVIAATARVFDTDETTIATLLNEYPSTLASPVIISDRLSYDDAVRAILALGRMSGTRLLVTERRDYRGPDGRERASMGHLLGYVGRISAQEYATRTNDRYQPSNGIGKSGIEASYETLLRGTPGIRMITVDAYGRTVGVAASDPPRAGSALVLTIDARIQDTADAALQAAFRASGARRGAVIALDPESGEILALVSAPTFSATAFSQGLSVDAYAELVRNNDNPLFPRAISGLYPSGSTVKPFLAAAALANETITPATRIMSTGGFSVQGSTFPDWKAGGHGYVDVRRAIAESVNTFFYVIGGGWPNGISNFKFQISNSITPLGPEGIASALRAFGFGEPTGIDIAGEGIGLIPTPEWKRAERDAPWYIGDTYHLAFGQGDLLVTPLQVARATAAIANGGALVTPHLALDSRKPIAPMLRSGSRHGVVGTDSRRPIPGISVDAINVVRDGMRLAVTDGSARGLAMLPFTVFGKTGTAQTDSRHRPHAWFTGFAEARSPKPEARSQKIVVTIIIEEGGEGSTTAVPVARDVLAAWARTME